MQEEKKASGIVIPSLKVALRNSKEIIDFDKTLEPDGDQTQEQEEEEETKEEISISDKLDIRTNKSSQDLIDSKDNLNYMSKTFPYDSMNEEENYDELSEISMAKSSNVKKLNLPNSQWPKSGLNAPIKPFGCEVNSIVSVSLSKLYDDVKKSFQPLSPNRVLVIVFAKDIPELLIDTIKLVRSSTPLVVQREFDFNDGKY